MRRIVLASGGAGVCIPSDLNVNAASRAVRLEERRVKRKILAVVDFSPQSDRALRRASLLARRMLAELTPVHVIEDEPQPRLIAPAAQEKGKLLNKLAATMRMVDYVPCDARIAFGEPIEATAELAQRIQADVIVMGPHRRRALRDMFTGTTTERTIERAGLPVIVANGVPAGHYDRVLLATDFSSFAAAAARALANVRIADGADVIAFHAVDLSARNLIVRSAMSMDQWNDHVADEEGKTRRRLAEFVRRTGLRANKQTVAVVELTVALTICEAARKENADLIVVGTQGLTGAARYLSGSVAEEVLRTVEVDIMVVPAVGMVDGDILAPPPTE